MLLAGCTLACVALAGDVIHQPHIKWKFKTDAPIRGSVAISEGKLFFGNSSGTLYCLDKESAREIWRFSAGGAIVSQPLVAGGKVVFLSRDHKVYALDAATGKQSWVFEMGQPVPHIWGWDYYDAAPVAYGSNVFIGSGDNNLYALSMKDGKLQWKFSAKDKIRATPLLVGDRLYVPSFDGFLYQLNAKTGKKVSSYQTEGVSYYTEVHGWDRTSIVTRPGLENDKIVIGSRDGGLYALDAATLEKQWRFTYGSSWVGSSPAIDGNTVYVGWSDALVVSAHDLSTGKELWKYNGGSYFYSTPVVDNENLYIGSFNGKVYGFDKTNGTVAWKYQTGGSVLSSPVLEDGTLYIGSDNGYLYAFAEGKPRHLAVYHPDINGQKELLASDKCTPYFEDLGYSRLDTAGLVNFMNEHIADKQPGTIVFAHMYLPKAVAGKTPAEGLLKKFMEAGGRVVWLGYYPNYWLTNKDLRIVASNPQYAADLLEIDFDVHMDFGMYYSEATEEGLKWGVPASFEALGSSIAGGRGIVPLATNEFGRVASFWKPIGTLGGGCVSFCSWNYMPMTAADLDIVRNLAEYGL